MGIRDVFAVQEGAPWEGRERRGRGTKGADMLHRRGHHRREVGREGDATMGGGRWGRIFSRGRASIGGRGGGAMGGIERKERFSTNRQYKIGSGTK